MEQRYAGLQYEQILPLILALLLIFILPMLMRRHGWSWEDLFSALFSGTGKRDRAAAEERRIRSGKERPEPHLKNGGKGEMMELLSTLLTFSRRNGLTLVYPGTVPVDGESTTLLALLVTRSEVIGINCFGFAGTITAGRQGESWNQHMNGADIEIPNPRVLNRKQYQLLRKAMNAQGMTEVGLEILAVFTNRSAVLAIGADSAREVMTRQQLVELLREKVSEEKTGLDPQAVAAQLNRLVVRVKKQR